MSASVRAVAAQVLAGVMRNGKSLNELLGEASNRLAAKDRPLLQELCFGTCRFAHRYQKLLKKLLQKPLKEKDADIEALLLLGLHQLHEMRIPDHAAISATVECALELKKPWAKALINGVLRNAQRQGDGVGERLRGDLEYQFSHPTWLVEQLREAWPHYWRAVLEANNQHPPMTLRVNPRFISRNDYLQLLNEKKLSAEPCSYARDGLVLDSAINTADLPGFAEGWLSVQDEAAQLAAQLLQLKPGLNVLDACCAPGGKTCHILELEPELQSLLGVDVSESRLQRVRDNLERLQLSCALKAADIADTDAWWDGTAFDRILLDAPCSATGVIRRHPDIKLLRRANDIGKLAQLQSSLLAKLWMCLKPGGLLLYATCSVLPQENEAVVSAFVESTDDAELEPMSVNWGSARVAGRQLFPASGGHDGFYYALLRKSPA